MSWSTELFCNISFNRQTFNNKEEVQNEIDNLNRSIEVCKKEIRNMAFMTEPQKFVSKDEDPYSFVEEQVTSNLELLEEYLEDRLKLYFLLSNWEKCHNKEGLAIYPPDNIKWNTAYLHGDYVKSTKFPNNKSFI